jgi:predicted RNA methylase
MHITHKSIIDHLPFINDEWRNKFYKSSLEKHAKDNVVLDVGSGTGILSFYALSSGAKFVYCVEFDPIYANITDNLLSKNFDRSRFKVLNINFWDTDLSKFFDFEIDILVTETFGPGLFDQGILNTWHCLKPYISKNFISIPDTVHFDILQWNKQIIFPKNEHELQKDSLLDDRIYSSLVEIDLNYWSSIVHWSYIKNNNLFKNPDKIYKDILKFDINNLPKMEVPKDYKHNYKITQKDIPSSKTIFPIIEFEIDTEYEDVKTLSFKNKISFENQILFLEDAKYCDWKKSPIFTTKKCKNIKFKFNRIDLSTSQMLWKID